MKQDHQTSFGRHISAVPKKSEALIGETGLCDKWQLLTSLTESAEDFGLTHRSISVLRALISFHPDRMIATSPLSCVVFPANRTLSQRLGGMPESTLRRHLATLVSAGIVSRHDSANRKRFARGGAGGSRLAFGFDLSPMARMATAITARGDAAKECRARLQTLRIELAALRQQLIDATGPDEVTDNAFKLLRRKPEEETLNTTIVILQNKLLTSEMSSSDDQNERHIQAESIIYSEDPKTSQKHDAPSFEVVVTQCLEYLSFFPEPARDWQDLSRIAYALCPMMGIERPVYAQAIELMGATRAITAVLCILENLSHIGNPGGYLRRLTQQSMEGRLCFQTLMKSRKR